MPHADRPPRRWWRMLIGGASTGLILALILEAVNVLAGPNTHEVIPNLVYRTSQPCRSRLERLIRADGIHTIVNFRGVCDDSEWYRDECRVAAKYGVSMEDFNGCSSSRLPSVHHVRDMVRILDDSEYPILFHCNRGIDRTGWASAFALLLKTDTPLPVALEELGVRHGHLRWGRTGHIDRFYVLYQEWLEATKQSHSNEVFRRWTTQEYCAGDGSAEITLLGLVGKPDLSPSAQPPGLHPLTPNVYPPEYHEGETLRLPLKTPPTTPLVSRPCGVRVRCRNTSAKPWLLQAESNTGIHAIFLIDDEWGKSVTEGRSGLFDAVVPPEKSIDLTLAIPPLKTGRYLLRVDMTDEQHAHFHQVGSRQLFVTLEVQ
jgi:protein tyrosine/serine phosphatase